MNFYGQECRVISPCNDRKGSLGIMAGKGDGGGDLALFVPPKLECADLPVAFFYVVYFCLLLVAPKVVPPVEVVIALRLNSLAH